MGWDKRRVGLKIQYTPYGVGPPSPKQGGNALDPPRGGGGLVRSTLEGGDNLDSPLEGG